MNDYFWLGFVFCFLCSLFQSFIDYLYSSFYISKSYNRVIFKILNDIDLNFDDLIILYQASLDYCISVKNESVFKNFVNKFKKIFSKR